MGYVDITGVDSLNYNCDVCGPNAENRVVPTVGFNNCETEFRICQDCIKKALAMLVRHSRRGLVLEGYE